MNLRYPIPDHLDDPIFREVFGYWRSKFRGNLLPSRKDIDPLEIPKALGHIVLIEVLDGVPVPRFRYRLWGTRVTELYGKDYTNCFLEDVVAKVSKDQVQSALEGIVKNKLPHFWQTPVPVEGRAFESKRRVMLPLSSDGIKVDMLMGVYVGDKSPLNS